MPSIYIIRIPNLSKPNTKLKWPHFGAKQMTGRQKKAGKWAILAPFFEMLTSKMKESLSCLNATLMRPLPLCVSSLQGEGAKLSSAGDFHPTRVIHMGVWVVKLRDKHTFSAHVRQQSPQIHPRSGSHEGFRKKIRHLPTHFPPNGSKRGR